MPIDVRMLLLYWNIHSLVQLRYRVRKAKVFSKNRVVNQRACFEFWKIKFHYVYNL